MTPLLLAVKNGMWSCVEYLLDHQASIEHCDKQKRTCLIIAATEGHLAVIDSLLEKGFIFSLKISFVILFFLS
jgi:ankyrin repeat protein